MYTYITKMRARIVEFIKCISTLHMCECSLFYPIPIQLYSTHVFCAGCVNVEYGVDGKFTETV
jgi:hypothetical protein